MGEALSMKSCVSSGISVRRTLREKLRSIRLIFPTPPCLINQQSGQGEQEGSSFSLEFPFSLTSVGGVHSSESSDNPNLAWCPVRLLPLPNMLSARAQYSFGGHLFGQLLFANRARLRHYVCHKLASPPRQSRLSKCLARRVPEVDFPGHPAQRWLGCQTGRAPDSCANQTDARECHYSFIEFPNPKRDCKADLRRLTS